MGNPGKRTKIILLITTWIPVGVTDDERRTFVLIIVLLLFSISTAPEPTPIPPKEVKECKSAAARTGSAASHTGVTNLVVLSVLLAFTLNMLNCDNWTQSDKHTNPNMHTYNKKSGNKLQRVTADRPHWKKLPGKSDDEECHATIRICAKCFSCGSEVFPAQEII